ncbi:Cu(I)/Ag(I) efflux system periplasmic protein CusF [Escherichia coli]|nr:Cu(I)/Ag(I) efflux system periplasmic protein CusF [Escherichia coli]
MKKALQVAMFSLFTVIGFNAQANEHHHETMSEAQPQVISATGVVKGVDLESKKITIHHDPIAAVNWPEMTMRFTITPQTKMGNDSNLLIVFYVQIMPDDFVMQLHRF